MLTEISTYGWFGDGGLLSVSTVGWFIEGGVIVDFPKGIFVGMDGIFDEGVFF